MGGPWAGQEDHVVVRTCLDGDAEAWEELVARYKALVYSIPRTYGLDPSTCDDVFQEVFAILLRKLPELRNQRALPKWFMTTTQRTTRRIAGKMRSTSSAQEQLLAENPPAAMTERWEQQQLVRESLRRLGGRCEQLLRAMYAPSGAQSYEVIAEQLGMAVGSIGPTRARCLERLMGIIEAMDEEHLL